MFKPVSGLALQEFDEETRALYGKRESDPRLTQTLLMMPRRARSHLPVIADPDHPWLKANREELKWFPAKMLGSFFFFNFAAQQFSKIYYPGGIIVRRSIPTTWVQYVSRRAPIGLFFLGYWYYQREYPRTERIDLTSDTES